MPDSHSLVLKAKQIIQLNWKNWNDVCAIPRLVSRENPGKDVSYCHDNCGEIAPYISLVIPTNISAVATGFADNSQHAFHGDYILVLNNNKILVVANPIDSDAICAFDWKDEPVTTLDAAFVYNREDFPLCSTWVHTNGNQYSIVGYNNEPDDKHVVRAKYPAMIEYRNTHTGKKYSGPAHDWRRRMTRIK